MLVSALRDLLLSVVASFIYDKRQAGVSFVVPAMTAVWGVIQGWSPQETVLWTILLFGVFLFLTNQGLRLHDKLRCKSQPLAGSHGGERQITQSVSDSPSSPPIATTGDGSPVYNAPFITASVVSVGQIGGQTAQRITNVGLQPRTLSGVGEDTLISRLSKYCGTEIRVLTLALDGEAQRFAKEIQALLEKAGWKLTHPLNATLLEVQYQGVAVRCPGAQLPEPLKELTLCLREAGFYAAAVLNAESDGYDVAVLSNGVPSQ